METIVKRPEIYDAVLREVDEDVIMYIEMLKEMPYIVEYGAGTGRIAIPMAEAGIKVIAVDNEEKMLEAMRHKMSALKPEIRDRIQIKNDNMITFKHDEKVPAILIARSTLNYLTKLEDQNETIKNASNLLRKNGILILELLTMKTFPEVLETDQTVFIKKVELDDNTDFEYFRNSSYNENTKILTQNRFFKFYNKQGEFLKQDDIFWVNGFITIEDITTMLNKNGFEIMNLYGDCNYGEYNSNSEFVIIKAIKK